MRAFRQTSASLFEELYDAVLATSWRRELVVEEIPAPQRIAPNALALGAYVMVGEDELGGGHLIVLHDPDGNASWDGELRCVTYAHADVDEAMAADALLPGVAWSWLLDALDRNCAPFHAPSGTVTTVSSTSFGAIEDEVPGSRVELRASWTPVVSDPADIVGHLSAWGDLLCLMSGLPPLPEGVVPIARHRSGTR